MWSHLDKLLMLGVLLMDKDAIRVWGKVTEGRKDSKSITPMEDTIEGRGRQLTKPIFGLDATVDRQDNPCLLIDTDYVGNDLNYCGDKTDTAQLCQELCKNTNKCVQFSWLGEEFQISGESNGEHYKKCCMKSFFNANPDFELGVISGEKHCVACTDSTTCENGLGCKRGVCACIDETNGALDSDGDGCEYYDIEPTDCGDYDDEDFKANSMCCACE